MAPVDYQPAPAQYIDRIRRQAVDPVFEHLKCRLPSKLTFGPPALGLELHYGQSRWHRHLDVPYVRTRHLRAKLFVKGAHAGSFDFTEIRADPLIASQTFFDWADGISFSLSQLAEVLCSQWEDVSAITDYGTILELSRAWMHPGHSRDGRFGQAARALIGLSTDWALLALKAFPLEYEGTSPRGSTQFDKAQQRRQRAMMRHYRATLGVQPFPSAEGDDGWMFSIRNGLPIPKPVPGSGSFDL